MRRDQEQRPTHRARTPEQERTRNALKRLTDTPEWEEFLKYFKDRLWRETVDPRDPNPSALFMIEGRRSFHRELERLGERLLDDRRSDDPE